MEKRSSWPTVVWGAVITIVVILIGSMLWLTLQPF